MKGPHLFIHMNNLVSIIYYFTLLYIIYDYNNYDSETHDVTIHLKILIIYIQSTYL